MLESTTTQLMARVLALANQQRKHALRARAKTEKRSERPTEKETLTLP
jgi:hypothetical protein